MANVRTEFTLPFPVKTGTEVLDELGKSVGFVVEIGETTEDSSGNKRFSVTADIAEESVKSKLQCMETII